MKVIGFIGSPRRNGNTDILVQQVLRGAEAAGAETKFVYLNEISYKGCQGCESCKVNSGCVQQDDMSELYDEIANAEAIVIGSPIYLWQISGQTKLFLDRWYAFGNHDTSCKLRKGIKGALVFSQGDPDQERYQDVFSNVANLLSFGLEIQNTIVASGASQLGIIATDAKLMQKAWTVGTNLVTNVVG